MESCMNDFYFTEEKMFVARNNSTFKTKDVKELFIRAKNEITVEKWEKAEKFVIENIEKKFWEMDGVMDENMDPFIIHVDNDGDEEDEENDDDDGGIDDDDDDDEVQSDFERDDYDEELIEMEHVDDDDVVDDGDDDAVCQGCDQHEPINVKGRTVTWVFCNYCDNWFHLSCAGSKFNENEIKNSNLFSCSDCASKLSQKIM